MRYGFLDRLGDMFVLLRRKREERREKRDWTISLKDSFGIMYSTRDRVLEYVNNVLNWEVIEMDEDTCSILCRRKNETTIPDAKSHKDKE